MNKEFFKGMNLAQDISEDDFNLIVEEFKKVEDIISKDQFISEFNERKSYYEDSSLISDNSIVSMIVGPLSPEENEALSEITEESLIKINDAEDGNHGFNVIARVMTISNPKEFTSSKGKPGKLCNIDIADDTGEVRLTLWSQNIKHLKNVKEGDIVKFTDVDCRINSYNRKKEFSLRPRSTMNVLDEESSIYPENISDFPVYEEKITPISEISHEGNISILGRLVKVPKPRSYDSNGKNGKVLSLEILDKTGKIQYTLWNNDVYIVSALDLKEGDIVKILNEQVRERDGEFSISHWSGRILKVEGDYDIPEYSSQIIKIGDAHEQKDVIVHGIVTKVSDTVELTSSNGEPGFVKTIEIGDGTGTIRVTLWRDDTKMNISKGDMLKVIGGNVEYDDFSRAYRVNTNWNSEFKINAADDLEIKESLEEKYHSRLVPIEISKIQEFDEEDGVEVDILARLIDIYNGSTFIRDDGTEGMRRSGIFADASKGIVRVTFWDDKAEFPFAVGRAYKIENAKTRLNNTVELNVNKSARVMEIPELQVENLPPLDVLEDLIYETRPIGDLDEDDTNIKIIGRIMDVQDIHEFTRDDGSVGVVRSIDIGDKTGIIRASLWDSKADMLIEVGDPIKVQNPRIRYDNGLKLNIGSSSNILEPSIKELNEIPSTEELESILFTAKDIGMLEEEESNVKVHGTLKNIYTDKILIYKCPFCDNTIDKDDKECVVCNNEIVEPKYTLILSGVLEDETDEIEVAFFNNLAEEIIGIKKEDIIKIINESNDENILMDDLNKLNGMALTLLADVIYDEIGDRNQLRPRKIISKDKYD
jgi:replication factor A1